MDFNFLFFQCVCLALLGFCRDLQGAFVILLIVMLHQYALNYSRSFLYSCKANINQVVKM